MGLPVIAHDTGFASRLPTGAGLFGFATTDDILTAIDTINADYLRHCRAAPGDRGGALRLPPRSAHSARRDHGGRLMGLW